jgi:pyruvyltransferase
MNKVNLFWYRGNVENNFGDELGPYIVQKLSGKKISRIHVLGKSYSLLKGLSIVLISVFKSGGRLTDIVDFFKERLVKHYIVSVGSIIQFGYSRKAIVWGSGILSRGDKLQQATFRAVRGRHTQKRISELGMTAPEAIGDPAILLPYIYKPSMVKRYKLGVVPHIIHFEKFVHYMNDDIRIIDFRNENIEIVISELLECEMILSSSLHGVIVPHAYGIPSLWCECPSLPLKGDNVKFLDYFSAVGIEDYEPMNMESVLYNIDNQGVKFAMGYFNSMALQALPNESLMEMRRQQLLQVKPF